MLIWEESSYRYLPSYGMSHVRLVIHFNGNVYSPLRIVNYHDYNNVISIYISSIDSESETEGYLHFNYIFSSTWKAQFRGSLRDRKVASSTLSFMDSKFESYFIEGIYFVGL